ncbi:MAG: hypothetical protein ACJAVR_000380 [Paracoccaceae bacterium]|jgi:hypothetical protein
MLAEIVSKRSHSTVGTLIHQAARLPQGPMATLICMTEPNWSINEY